MQEICTEMLYKILCTLNEKDSVILGRGKPGKDKGIKAAMFMSLFAGGAPRPLALASSRQDWGSWLCYLSGTLPNSANHHAQFARAWPTHLGTEVWPGARVFGSETPGRTYPGERWRRGRTWCRRILHDSRSDRYRIPLSQPLSICRALAQSALFPLYQILKIKDLNQNLKVILLQENRSQKAINCCM